MTESFLQMGRFGPYAERLRPQFEDVVWRFRTGSPWRDTRACDLAHAFADRVRHRRAYLLLEWIRQAEQGAPKLMQGCAGFLRQDLDTVTAVPQPVTRAGSLGRSPPLSAVRS
ncbi:hypothetical protein ABT187_40620 [Streptomyces sp. NPDC001817]|uniref:hypothetical protein n=1 Tax=Streptomyces sp. NPDC001817 TaxID=3154398 RepID=UPI00332579BF